MEKENTGNIKGKLIRTGLAGIVIGGLATACAKPVEGVELKTSTQSPLTETMPPNLAPTESPFVEVKPEVPVIAELPDSVDLSSEVVSGDEVFMGGGYG